MQNNKLIDIDVVIVGGGITGLWLNNALYNLGYNCILIEKNKLGSKQTIMSQGIIHGGTKYNLLGKISNASNIIAGMPNLWQNHLKNFNDKIIPKLDKTKILSSSQNLFSTQTISAKITTFFASKLMKSKVQKINNFTSNDNFLCHFKNKSAIYKLNEFVIDIKSLIKNLQIKQNTIQHSLTKDSFLINDNQINKIKINSQIFIKSKLILFTAGEENQKLTENLKNIDDKIPQMQIRPLHMLTISSNNLPIVFAHCMSTSNLPKFTITTHQNNQNIKTWYIGGGLAEAGINLTKEQQIDTLKNNFNNHFPWLNLNGAVFNSYFINRAEAKNNNIIRPDDSFIYHNNNYSIIWPTKLALVPTLLTKVLKIIKNKNIKTKQQIKQKKTEEIFKFQSKPKIADFVWNE